MSVPILRNLGQMNGACQEFVSSLRAGLLAVYAYNAYLQGRYFYERRSKENLEKAVGYYEQAILSDKAAELAMRVQINGPSGFQETTVSLSQVESFLGFWPCPEDTYPSARTLDEYADLDRFGGARAHGESRPLHQQPGSAACGE